MKRPTRIHYTMLLILAASVTSLGYAHEARAAEYPFTTENDIADVSTNAAAQWADMDGDGDADVVVVRGELAWYENPGALDQPFEEHQVEPTLEVTEFAVGDIDGDGDLDLVGGGDEVRWYENVEGAQAFVPHTLGTEQAEAIVLGDFNGDGNLDIAIGDYETGEPGWYTNPGDATASWGSLKVIPSALFDTDDLTAGDYDGDGDDDLIAADSYNGYLSLLSWNNGPWLETELSAADTPHQMRTIDYDGDGDLDVLSGRETKALVMTNVAPGVFGSLTLADSGYSGQDFSLDAGDVDGDGDLDIVSVGSNEASWFENVDGDYTEHEFVVSNGDLATGVSIADADCDGDADMVVKVGFYIRVYPNETNQASADGCGGGGGDDDGGDDAADGGGLDESGGEGGEGGEGGGDAGEGGGGDAGEGGDEAGTGGDGGGDGTGGDGGAEGDDDDGGIGGLCSVDPSRGVPASALALLLLALGYRRRR